MSRLTSHYIEELRELRSSAKAFSYNHPEAANELSLDGGISRDPHVEHLFQSFAWMSARLRSTLENESSKLPALLLNELAPSSLLARPAMAIVQCQVDGRQVDLTSGYTLRQANSFAPVGLPPDQSESSALRECRFSCAFDTVVRPLEISGVRQNDSSSLKRAASAKSEVVRSTLDLEIRIIEARHAGCLDLDSPLRVFIDLEQQSGWEFYDFLASSVTGFVITDEQGRFLASRGADAIKVAGFADSERMLVSEADRDLSSSLIEDYYAFPRKFLFFDIDDLQNIGLGASADGEADRFTISLQFNSIFPTSMMLEQKSFKLNCVPVVNLFERTCDPVIVTEKEYRYPVVVDRGERHAPQVHRIVKVAQVNSDGSTAPIEPYFREQFFDGMESSLHWISERGESGSGDRSAPQTFLSIFAVGEPLESEGGVSLVVNASCCNGALAEQFKVGQRFTSMETTPLGDSVLLTRPTPYHQKLQSRDSLWRLVSNTSRIRHSIADAEMGLKQLQTTLMAATRESDREGIQQIKSIESVSVSESVMPFRKNAWRGYYTGLHYEIVLNPRMFQGSAMLFGRVLIEHLSMFSHLNSFASLELFIGDRSVYKWKPRAGTNILA